MGNIMIKYKKPKATLLSASPLNIGEVSGRVCYDSFSMSENEDIQKFPETKELGGNIYSSELLQKLTWVHFHESVLEHINLSFFIEDISREVVIEMNRHRLGIATSQQSTRYTIEDIVDAWIEYRDTGSTTNFIEVVAKNIVDANNEMIGATASYIANKLSIYDAEEKLIKGLTGSKKKKQNDRVKRCLPEVWLMRGVWTFNLRALKHFMELRDSGSAYYGIREVCDALNEVIPTEYKSLIKKEK